MTDSGSQENKPNPTAGPGLRAGYLGLEESPAVVPDLRVLPAVGGGAHRGRPGVSGVSSDRQVLVLGPVLDPDVHCRLRRGKQLGKTC